ncbi:MAG TPA: ankyrin repeat domain-containing protein [Bryobacteraceae bacterium]|nr:ankyrin repeat domain-containing protein [Bryobacteraceae bacterium]
MLHVTVFGSTALTMAALTGDAANVALLLKHGANPNAPGPKGLSASHLAVQRGDREMARLLLDAGADVKLRTANGESVLERYGFGTTRRWFACCWKVEWNLQRRTHSAETACSSQRRQIRLRRSLQDVAER